MYRLLGVVKDTNLGLCFCISDSFDNSTEVLSENDIKFILGIKNGILNNKIENISLDNDNNLIYPSTMFIDSNDILFDDDDDEYEDDEYEDDYDEDIYYDDDINSDEDISSDEEYLNDVIEFDDEDDEEYNYTEIEDLDDYEDDEDYLYDFDDEDEDDRTGVISKLYELSTDEQVKLYKEYYMWFSERVFTKAQQSTNIDFKNTLGLKDGDYRKLKKNALDAMRGNFNWRYAGFVHYRHKGDIVCDVQMINKDGSIREHKLKNAHIVWKIDNITNDIENDFLSTLVWGRRNNEDIDYIIEHGRDTGDCLVFGIDCLCQFFGIEKEGKSIILKGQRLACDDLELLYNIITSNEGTDFNDAVNSFKLTDEIFSDVETADTISQLIGEDRLFKYDKLIDYYKRFRKLDMIPPKTLVQELRDSLLGWTKNYSERTNYFTGYLKHITSGSVLFSYLSKIYDTRFTPMHNVLTESARVDNDRIDEKKVRVPRKYFYKTNSERDFNKKVLDYIESLFTYEVTGYYKYGGVANKNDEGGNSKSVRASLHNLYGNISPEYFLSDVEYSKSYFEKLMDLYSVIDKLKLTDYLDGFNYSDFDDDFTDALVYVKRTSVRRCFEDFYKEIDLSDDEFKKIETFLLMKIDFVGETIDSLKQKQIELQTLLLNARDKLNNFLHERKIKKEIEEEKRKKEERKREEEKHKEEERRREEEKRSEDIEKSEVEESHSQENNIIGGENNQNNTQVSSNINTPKELIEFLDNFDYNSVDTSKLNNYNLRKDILKTVVDKKKYSNKQFYHLKMLYKDITGIDFIDSSQNNTNTNNNSNISDDLKNKLQYLITNQNKVIKNSSDNYLFSIASSVIKYGRMSSKQKYNIDKLINNYNDILQNI